MSNRPWRHLVNLALAVLGISIGGNIALAASGDIIDLGLLSGETWDMSPRAINDGGVVVGHHEPSNTGFRWSQSTGLTALPYGIGGPSYINNQDVILFGGSIFYPNGSTEGPGLAGVGMNNTGDIVVGSGNGGAWETPLISRRDSTGNWKVQNLGTPDRYAGSANGINNYNVIVGQFGANQSEHAFRYTDAGGMEDIGILPGACYDHSAATAINNQGTIVGWSYGASSTQAIRYTDADGLQPLELDAYGTSRAKAINDLGLIAGQADAQAVAWDAQGHLINLNEWLQRVNPDAASRWELLDAADVNNSNLILGYGILDHDGIGRSFVLDATGIAVPEPASWILAGIAGLLLAARYCRAEETKKGGGKGARSF
jgi:probable HAF family extracellular repeat protein